jgi:hypothetical protein
VFHVLAEDDAASSSTCRPHDQRIPEGACESANRLASPRFLAFSRRATVAAKKCRPDAGSDVPPGARHGTAVSAIYLNQPLLSTLARSLGAPHETVGLIATLTQVGYALGILFLVPLGDVLPKKRLVTTKLALLAVALAGSGAARNVGALWAGSTD